MKNNCQLLEEGEFSLPKGRAVKKLGEVCEIRNGGTPKTGNKEYWNGGIKWITPKDLGKLNDIYVADTLRKISEIGLQKSSAKIIPKNSIILSTRAPIGYIAINTLEMATNQGCRGIIPSNKIIEKYLFYFLRNSVNLLNDLGVGTTFKELSTKALASVQIPVPSLPEQKRIVAILDRTFKAIDQAKTNAEQNLKNAKELFESYLQNIFKNNNWERYKIENLTSLITKGSSPNWQGVNYVENSGIFFLTSKNVGEGELLLKNKKYLEEKFNKIQKTSILKKGDVLTNIVGASIGRTAIFDLEEVTNINQAVCLMRCLPNKTYNYYLMYLLNSPFFKNILHNNEVNNARANLSLTFFKHLLIPVPELSEQIKITERIKQFLSETKKLETIYQQKINNLVELKKSILQQAFKGEL
ncbi:restriction endonuclease subunit S [bacterium endosymbiont of Bathymodiolus sp. 5 South]|uniref:restriction endonuclease subunit S n=1 Tax=bacterium endosymbiont of Bathymodiolus sp. 5 South TaxID=1181670 RepID=UPI0015D59F69|nr:restriction endonuclease subunit S [bacterium endosymbiont of Bathymodiolus sp. 5 South]